MAIASNNRIGLEQLYRYQAWTEPHKPNLVVECKEINMTAIDDKYNAIHGSTLLGEALAGEQVTADGAGRFRIYQRGRIYWHPSTGAFEVHGAILDKYLSMGADNGALGYPLIDESGSAKGGRFSRFVNGSIYWTHATGAHPVWGPIRDKWETMGWEYSIGYPTADPLDTTGSEIRQRFEGGIMIWTPQNGISVVQSQDKVEKVLRVFLVAWNDIQPPVTYSRNYFQKYFFGVGESFPNPDGAIVPGSLHDYFYRSSDGYLRLVGEVGDWVRNPQRVIDLAHYFPGVVWSPGGARLESAAVAHTFRTLGIRTIEDLKVNGRVPDCLVFFHLDVWGGGGASRTMANVKEGLRLSGRLDLWDASWDTFINQPYIMVSVCQQEPSPTALPNGTFATAPLPEQLRWSGNSAIHHELVHALLSMNYDIYDGAWGFGNSVLEVMSHSVVGDQPVLMSSYVQERCGWLSIEDLPRRSHRDLLVAPLDTHSVAFRLQNGHLANPETVVFENRSRWDYHVTPATRLSNILFAYSIDPRSRRLRADGGRLTGRIINGPASWWDSWGLPESRNLTGRGPYLGNSLNPLGECWWELRNIRVQEDNMIMLDVNYRPTDLLRLYTGASWTNARGETLTPDAFAGERGHVMMIGRSLPLEQGLRYQRVLSLHPDWNANGLICGRYRILVPTDGARLYLTAALSEQAVGSDGISISVRVNGAVAVERTLTLARNLRTLVADLSTFAGTMVNIEIIGSAGPTATRDWLHVLEAWVVPTARVITDLIRTASGATWTTNAGNIAFNGAGGANGEIRTVSTITLQNGQVYGGPVLQTHPASRSDGFIEGKYGLTLPSANAVLRAELGFDERRAVTDNGARISARFVANGGVTTNLVTNALLERRPAMGEKGLGDNPSLAMAAVIPDEIRGQTGQLVLRVDADGSALQDWVYWAMARLTTD